MGTVPRGNWSQRVARGLRRHGLRGELMYLARRVSRAWRRHRERSLHDVLAAHPGTAHFGFQNINAPESVARLRALAPDVIMVAAFMQILKPAVIAVPPLVCINAHPSLLPRYRGPAPLYWARKNRERAIGVTVHYIDECVDTGDIIVQESFAIEAGDNNRSLRAKSAATGARLLVETVRRLAAGETLPRRPQDHTQATYFRLP